MKKVLVLLLHLLWLTSFGPVHSEENQPPEPFSRAYILFSQGELSKAENLFVKALNQGSVLDDYSLYFLGVISFSREAFDIARNYFSQLKKSFPRSVWFNHANLQLAKISLREGNDEQAIGELRDLETSGVANPISNEALYLLGETYEKRGELNLATSFYQKLRHASPLSLWARRARRKVESLREQHPQLLSLTEPEAALEEGELLSRERDYDQAERIYRRFSGLVSGGNLRLRFLVNLAKVYRKARKREKEIGVLTEILEQYPGNPEASTALARLAQVFWNQGKDLKALTEFRRLKELYPKSPLIDFADFASARIYESLQETEEAIRIYQDFPRRFPYSRLREQAAWRLAWIFYLQGDYRHAHATFKRIARGKGLEHCRTAALFWQARAAERMGHPEEAKRNYRQILSAQDDTYYMGPAARALKRMGESVEEKKTKGRPFLPETIPPLGPTLSFHLSRAKKLAEITLHHLAVVELDAIKNQMGADPALRMMLIRQYARNRAYDRSVTLASQVNHPSDELHHYRYPLAYWEIIQKNAVKTGLDPYLILALIRQESLFDPRALSPASAFGLMQLLPSTAGREAMRLGLRSPVPERLFDADLNLTLGTHHLKELLQLYSNSLVKALAAYNAGRNAVDRWEREISVGDEEEFIERIPYRETRLYVKLVLRNYRIYKRLYDTAIDEKIPQK
ncbi:MAG: transglycosylase SLT domain-containing protein [Candidatus Binatia bacterium]